MVWALNIELRYSKQEILIKYVANAPFGGNVVGLEAASWRYYGRKPYQLSWAESATLAVLPNAPALIYPGKNDPALLEKRNNLLSRLLELNYIDSMVFALAKLEPLPEKVYSLPNDSYHLLDQIIKTDKGKKIETSIRANLQTKVNRIVIEKSALLKGNQIHNMAALVADVNSGKVLAYVGNVPDLNDQANGNHVDIIQAPRSSGSILKPFLYTAMIDNGTLTPQRLIKDVPGSFGGFTPVNFDKNFDGAVHANEALARSLNIPAVIELQEYGVEPFYYFLKNMGMITLNFAPDHYGLSLILGGE